MQKRKQIKDYIVDTAIIIVGTVILLIAAVIITVTSAFEAIKKYR